MQRGLTPQYKGFSAYTAKRDIMKSFKFYKEKLKSILHAHRGRFCLTSDLWTPRDKLGFLSLTIPYIESNRNLNKRTLSFKILESPHTGKNITNLITAFKRKIKLTFTWYIYYFKYVLHIF